MLYHQNKFYSLLRDAAFFLFLVCFACLTSCAKSYDSGEYYFLGMDSLRQENLKDALTSFRKSANDIYSYTGILSAEQAVRLEKASTRFTKTYDYYKNGVLNE